MTLLACTKHVDEKVTGSHFDKTIQKQFNIKLGLYSIQTLIPAASDRDGYPVYLSVADMLLMRDQGVIKNTKYVVELQ